MAWISEPKLPPGLNPGPTCQEAPTHRILAHWGRACKETEVTFTFTGAWADQHWLDGSDAVRYTEATRQLLAVHAHFYSNGVVPKGGALNETRYYRVFKSAPKAACFAEVWTVAIIGGALGNILGEYTRRAVDYGFANMFRDSIRPISARATVVHAARDAGYTYPERTGCPQRAGV